MRAEQRKTDKEYALYKEKKEQERRDAMERAFNADLKAKEDEKNKKDAAAL